MSVAFPNARPTQGMPAPNNKAYLLAYMKLRAPSDPIVHEKISEWVAFQNVAIQIHPSKATTCRAASALLLQRLVRAFENRQSSSSDDVKKTKVSTAISNRSNPTGSPTNGNYSPNMSPSRLKKTVRKTRKVLPPLSVLMQRKVKVTELVQQAVQFIGSDVLKVLQVSTPSPTVADVANACLNILNDEHRIKHFYRIFCEASGKDTSAIDESSSIFFGVFALQALQSLRAQAISAYQFSHDFEIIYRTCYQDQDFQICMHELNPATRPSAGVAPASFAPDTEARNICWKMARLLTLKYDYSKKSDPEAKDHRRNHILLSATSIILAANIGKSIKNGEIATGSASAQKGTIRDDIDFIALVAVPVSDLLNFLTKNTTHDEGITPICNADIRSHVMDTCVLINQLGIGERETISFASSSSNSLLAKAFSPAKHYILLQDYRNIIQTLVTETQKELKINTPITNPNQGRTDGANVRTGIVHVLLFFPMVIGEPWGIHRDAPMMTSKMLCSGENSKPPDPLKGSVAVVLEMKPRPKVIKRKAVASPSSVQDSILADNKKARTIALSKSPKKISNNASQEPIDLVGEVPIPPAPRAPIDVTVGEIEAPIVNDSSELNEWTISILSLSVIKPSDALLTCLGENDRMRGNGSSCLQDVIVHVLNRGVLRIQSALRSSGNVGSGVTATKLTVGRRDGQVYVNGSVDQNLQLCATVVGCYYYSLEAIIQDQMERMDFLASFGPQLQSRSFHRALLACCYSCILKGVGRNQKLQMNRTCENITVQVLMETTESDSFTFLKVVEGFCRALIATKESTQKEIGSPIVAGLPVILRKHLQKIGGQLIDSVLWNTLTMSESSSQACFTLSIKTMKGLPGAWPPDILEPMLPEEIADVEGDSSKSIEVRCKPYFGSSSEANFLSFVLRRLLKCIFNRIRAMCAALNLSNESTLHSQILVVFRYLLRNHISIFNDRHVDQLLLCSIYGVCRVMKIRPRISFGKVIDAYFTVRGEDQGVRACRVIVRHVKLASPGGNRPGSQVVGNIVVFYNTVYIPKMQKYFLGSKSLKKSALLYQIRCEKEEISKDNQISQKKDAAEKVPKESSAFTAAATTQISQPMNSPIIPAVVGLSNETLMQQGTTESSVEINGIIANSITVDLTKKPTSPNSAEKLSETNGDSPMVGKPIIINEPDPSSSRFVMENQTVNGPTSSGVEDADTESKQSTVAVRENSTSAGSANGPEQYIKNVSQGLNKPSTGSSDEGSSPPDKPTLVSGIVSSQNKNEMIRASPNGTVRTEGSTDDSQKKGLEITGETSTKETTASLM